MVDLDWKTKMVSTENTPKLSTTTKTTTQLPSTSSPTRVGSPASSTSCSDYEQYLRLPELSKLWNSRDFPNWKNEPILKPALQGLEITFRFISVVLSDPRPYANRREWKRRLESLTTHQIELIAMICEDQEEDSETRGEAPTVDLTTSSGVLVRGGSTSEVWKLPNSTHVVNQTSEASLLPRLATWRKSEDIASKIMYSIECEFRRCPFTLGLGEPNLSGKPNLEYDLIVKPRDLHSLKRTPSDHRNLNNYENKTLLTTHQILESWVQVSKSLLSRLGERIRHNEFEKSANDCWVLERVWKLLAEIEDLHMLMDPDDFLRLKNQLEIKPGSESEPFCFRSKGLIEITKMSKDLRHLVPGVLGVDVDVNGGPRVQEAAMKVFHGHRKGDFGKVSLVQALMAVEVAVKGFFFGYREVITVVMGSLEGKGNRGELDGSDALKEVYLETSWFPSLDAAKTFLGDFWQYEQQGNKK